MFHEPNQFRDLADRANRGDAGAAHELQRRLEPEMVRIIRRVLQAPGDGSPLARRVRAAVRRMLQGDRDWPAPDPEALIGQVARSLCDSMIARLGAGRRERAGARETVRS
jgi:hypothetical protein